MAVFHVAAHTHGPYRDRMLIKKYGNRRLYDTTSSRYITLEDLTVAIKEGAEVRVVDAKTNADLTQQTLTQIIIERRGGEKLLPSQLLHQLISLGDEALADFLGRYVQTALELYLQARKTTPGFMPFNPLSVLTGWGNPMAQAPMVAALPAANSEVEALRRDVDEIKGMLRKRRK